MYASLTTPIGKIFQPLLDAVGWILAFFYSIVPNYPIDVALLTIVIMALLTPLTVKSTKNMAAMQALGPEMKKLQQKYKGAENRAQMNEEMMKLYKEHNVNPASGCLPMLLQMPAFFILYSVIRGMTNTVAQTVYKTTLTGKQIVSGTRIVAEPRYIPTDSKMYHNIVAAHGQLISFGMDFSDRLLSHHSSIWVAIPYLLLVAGSVGLQYLQMSRLNARNPGAAQANPQAAMLQKYMPLIFGFIYINVAAILNVYFIVSSAIRILTQEILFRKGIVGGPPPPPVAGTAGPKIPAVDRTERALPKPKAAGGAGAKSNGAGAGTAKAGGDKSAGAVPAKASVKSTGANKSTGKPAATNKSTGSTTSAKSPNGPGRPAGKKTAGTANGSSAPKSNGVGSSNGSNGSSEPSTDGGDAAPKEHPRSKAKRERKAR
ncbi:MAG: membrane protein insertase YidC [Acidimicrobiales bacterium]